ncbi:hypothetical protein FPANT_13191 [Fusarium pseudoanthophilum]|uniref:Uncharacterized protein n=1 Tax=Fusarium pseudoanthophilum TaxID=48495 RepID=A0A8H5KFG2_9HYPO|nr:hypothetical protein FPANT_13191 [Fusarium pseudoanthophilum]
MSDQTNTTESSTLPQNGRVASSRPLPPDGYVSDWYPCSSHAINGPWNDRQNTLQRRIIEALGDIRWFTIDVWRIAQAESYEAMDLQDRSSRPLTILVSVRPGSTTVEQGEAAVLRCKKVLDEFDFSDVEVDISEAVGWGSLAER